MFFEVQGIEPERLKGFGEDLHFYFLLDRHVSSVEAFVQAESVRIGCTPMVNLFEHRCEPIRVNHGAHEYRIVPDARQPRAFEVHSVLDVTAIDNEREEKTYHPFYSTRHAGEQRERRGFFHIHRRSSMMSGGGQDFRDRDVAVARGLWILSRTSPTAPYSTYVRCARAATCLNDWSLAVVGPNCNSCRVVRWNRSSASHSHA